MVHQGLKSLVCALGNDPKSVKCRSIEIVCAISFYDLQEFHLMTDKFRFMTDKFHLMTNPHFC